MRYTIDYKRKAIDTSKMRIYINDRTYTKWSFRNLENNNVVDAADLPPPFQTINPVEHKLFSKDILSIISPIAYEVIYSSIKTNDKIAGVLILENNKTYGRTSNKKRLLYKCIPDDTHLPVFLVAYDVNLGFSKFQKNKYVVFKYDNWNDKHPHGIITETIGDVDGLDAFYEYQLYCKSLHISLVEFNNATRKTLKQHTHQEYIDKIMHQHQQHHQHQDPKTPNNIDPHNTEIEDHRSRHIFTIDPPNSTDFDDGFSITTNDENNTTTVTIYIANVYFWLETLSLWKSFSKRVATIYLPDRRRPMLPTILSDSLCSLQENQTRFAFALEITINNDTAQSDPTSRPTYKNVIINVAHNYRYEDTDLLHENKHYINLLNITQKMDKTVKTSHDLVSYWMIYMNKITGAYMAENKVGIFRATTYEPSLAATTIHQPDHIDHSETIELLNEDTQRVIKSWNNNIGKYVVFDESVSLEHHMMDRQYIHITSPIRRIVDLLNQMILCRHLKIVSLSQDAETFLNSWMQQIEYINTSMRSIRKIQTDCELINRCFTDQTIIHREHVGVVFDKIVKNDGTNHYMVYLENIKLLSRIITHVDIPVYSICKFSMFLFEDEYKTKRKIRLQLIG